MPTYTYSIRSKEDKLEKGLVQATNRSEAVAKVNKLGGTVMEVKEVKVGQGGFSLGLSRLSLKDRIIFTEQLSVMIKAGITLVQALKGLQEETSNKALARVLAQLVSDIEGGEAFSQALSKHPKVFSRIYCEMVRSSEKTGNLSEVLSRLTIQQRKEYELKGKVRGALIYPAIIFTLLVGVVILVITFILPKLSGLFSDSGADLPWSTKLLLSISYFFVHDWFVLVGALVAGLIGAKFALRTEAGVRIWDAFKLRVPILGSFIKKSYMARFTQSFAALTQAGVPVLEAFQTLGGVIGNKIYEEEIKKIAADVENGIKVSMAIRKSKYFPAMVGQLVSVGEQSGDLAGIFNVLGDFFEKEVDSMAKNLSTMLEPIIMVVMGAGIGFVLISVLQPIFNLANNI